ncbi:hypothetical protein AB0C27_40575 [Nonomuraea sp. NPDC048882]|uniref:hypothetical protein n=1 Tax=Nonomuraea sp. NPDC048882 TaxID=3154347 RepID=UPI0033C2BF25
MAWEWVAPVATGITGIVGTAFTWWAGHQGRRHAERVAQDAATSALARDREARRAAAYVDLLTVVVSNTDELTRITSSLMDPDEEEGKLVELRDEYIAVMGKAGVYGSGPIHDLLSLWGKCRGRLISAHVALREAIEGDPDGEHADLREKRRTERRELRDIAIAVRRRMTKEHA